MLEILHYGGIMKWRYINNFKYSREVCTGEPYCVHKVAQSRAECKPAVHKVLPSAQSDPSR